MSNGFQNLDFSSPEDDDTTKAQSTSSWTEVEPGEQELGLRDDPCPASEMITYIVHAIQVFSPKKQKLLNKKMQIHLKF